MFNPMDYGAVADGSLHPLAERYSTLAAARMDFPFVTALTQSLDWAALQQCLNLCGTPDALHFGHHIYIPHGSYYLDACLLLQGKWGVTVQGDGAASILLYAGSAGDGALKVSSCQTCTFSDFLIKQAGQNPLYGVWICNTEANTDGIVSSANNFRRVQIYDGHQTGFRVSFDTGGDANNDLHVFEDCMVKFFTSHGVHIHGSQVHQLRFVRCGFSGSSSTGTYGIWSDYGSYLTADNCTFNSCQEAIHTENFYPGVIGIYHSNSENCRGFARLIGTNCPVFIRGNRAALALETGDYALILSNGGGEVRIEDNTFYCLTPHLPLVKLDFGASSVVHTNNNYTAGTGAATWTTRGGGYGQGGGALQITPLSSGGYTIRSLVDLGNIYSDALGTHEFDTGVSCCPNSPAPLTANQPEYNCLPGEYQRWSATLAVTVSGMTGSAQGGSGYQGERREIWNVGAYSITLANNSPAPRTNARFRTSSGIDLVLRPGHMVLCRYDQTLNGGVGGWRTCGPF